MISLLVMIPFGLQAAGSCNLTLNTSHEDLFDPRLNVGTTVRAFVLHLYLCLSPDSLTLTRTPEPELETGPVTILSRMLTTTYAVSLPVSLSRCAS